MITMKQIKKLCLHPNQMMDAEELNSICGGKTLLSHTWNCNCTKSGDSCLETWTYLLDSNSYFYKATGLPEPVYTGPVVYNPSTAQFETQWQQWIADDSKKNHHAGDSGIF